MEFVGIIGLISMVNVMIFAFASAVIIVLQHMIIGMASKVAVGLHRRLVAESHCFGS